MFKTRLQEIATSGGGRSPNTPSPTMALTTTRVSLSPSPSTASPSPPLNPRSIEEAHNKAAQAAIDHLATVVPPTHTIPPPCSPAEGQVSYKSQLQNLLTRKNVVPMYGCVREGPLHALRFKATVAVDGQTFESPQFYKTLREAEHAAAKVALLALPQEESLQDETGSYKNLLQELTQKERLSLPIYKTVRDGSSHMPIFSSTVKIEDEFFNGEAAKTKKQAEVNAARVAWCQLKERRVGRVSYGVISSGHMQNDFQLVSARSESSVMDSPWPKAPSPQVARVKIDTADTSDKDQKVLNSGILDNNSIRAASADKSHKNDCEADKDQKVLNSGILDNNSFRAASADKSHKNDCEADKDQKVLNSGILDNNSIRAASADKNHKNDCEAGTSTETVETHNGYTNRSDTSLPERALVTKTKIQDLVDCTSCEDGVSSSSKFSPSSQIAEAKTSSMLRNRVSVYPQKPDLVLPEGATLLPFSDDKWVAVSLDFANSEGDISD